MTSPTDRPKPPITERISRRISFGRSSGVTDPEERFTRNVTIGFVVLIIAVAAVVVIGLVYGYYDANLRPVASVGGSEIGRGLYNDRVALERFRLERAERAVRAGLVEGNLDEDLANRRLTTISNEAASLDATALEHLVDLTFKGQLAEERGISLSDDQLAAAIAADGTAPEARRVSALIIRAPEQELGMPATAEGLAEARANAEAAHEALLTGTPFAEVAAEYSPVTADVDGDLGYLERADLTDGLWEKAIFDLEVGEVSDIIEGIDGELLIGMVTEISEPQPDPGFLSAVRDEVGEATHERFVEQEAIADELEEQVTDELVNADFDQVELSEILIRGDTFIDPADDEGSVRASHILYAPGELGTETPAEDDPAWAEAEADAMRAAEQLRAVADPDYRAAAFAKRAMRDSDGPTGPSGGDLGYFERTAMVPEFADPLFDADDLEQGDIVGPVRSEFGWHVIMFQDRKPPLAERLAEVQAALAADGADFADVAAQYSDAPDAIDGGAMGWRPVDELDELSAISIAAVDVGEVTEPVEGDEGWYIYKKEDEATRPLDEAAAARLAATAFEDWYQERRFDAEDEGRISIDDSFLGVPGALALAGASIQGPGA